MMFALVHPEHGTHFVYDTADLDRHLKLGWTLRPENWKELKRESERQKKLAALKAEQARIAAELEAVSVPIMPIPSPVVPIPVSIPEPRQKRKYVRKAA